MYIIQEHHLEIINNNININNSNKENNIYGDVKIKPAQSPQQCAHM